MVAATGFVNHESSGDFLPQTESRVSSLSYAKHMGKNVYVITKAQIRYEGILSGLDSRRSEITLCYVTMHGTEDRKADKVIRPMDKIYEYIVFRVNDIETFSVAEPKGQKRRMANGAAAIEGTKADRPKKQPNMKPAPTRQRSSSSFESVQLDEIPPKKQMQRSKIPRRAGVRQPFIRGVRRNPFGARQSRRRSSTPEYFIVKNQNGIRLQRVRTAPASDSDGVEGRPQSRNRKAVGNRSRGPFRPSSRFGAARKVRVARRAATSRPRKDSGPRRRYVRKQRGSDDDDQHYGLDDAAVMTQMLHQIVQSTKDSGAAENAAGDAPEDRVARKWKSAKGDDLSKVSQAYDKSESFFDNLAQDYKRRKFPQRQKYEERQDTRPWNPRRRQPYRRYAAPMWVPMSSYMPCGTMQIPMKGTGGRRKNIRQSGMGKSRGENYWTGIDTFPESTYWDPMYQQYRMYADALYGDRNQADVEKGGFFKNRKQRGEGNGRQAQNKGEPRKSRSQRRPWNAKYSRAVNYLTSDMKAMLLQDVNSTVNANPPDQEKQQTTSEAE